MAHSVMFHHFYDTIHPNGQGAVSTEDFESIIKYLTSRYNLVGARDFLAKIQTQTATASDICLSFDDGLLCQYDIALPVLKSHGISAFFFAYSSPFFGDRNRLEVYRHFRMTSFDTVDCFYKDFFAMVQRCYPEEYSDGNLRFDSSQFLSAYPFYTHDDKLYRFLRDYVLPAESFDTVMSNMMMGREYDEVTSAKMLWMNNTHLRNLTDDGHIVGLHSYSHPTTMHKLTLERQHQEYQSNLEHIEAQIRIKPVVMSHPCGNYNSDTLNVLAKLGIQLGFRSNMENVVNRSCLEVQRNDHANVMREMGL
jgi:peptidoglycan/xylan/chitin deacetylase (PgdA/CDA1 family)